jgi:hypothetical protein
MYERGVEVNHSTLCCWVQKYAPKLNKRCPTAKQSPTEENPAALSRRPQAMNMRSYWTSSGS